MLNNWYFRTQLTFFQVVIDKGADLNLQNTEGETAMTVAVKNKNKEMFDILLKMDCNLELSTTSGETVLWHSLQQELDHVRQ